MHHLQFSPPDAGLPAADRDGAWLCPGWRASKAEMRPPSGALLSDEPMPDVSEAIDV
jgi:hypothetical protein